MSLYNTENLTNTRLTIKSQRRHYILPNWCNFAKPFRHAWIWNFQRTKLHRAFHRTYLLKSFSETVLVSDSVTRSGEIPPLWQKFKTLWQFFVGLVIVGQNFKPTLANLSYYKENFHYLFYSQIMFTFQSTALTSRKLCKKDDDAEVNLHPTLLIF